MRNATNLGISTATKNNFSFVRWIVGLLNTAQHTEPLPWSRGRAVDNRCLKNERAYLSGAWTGVWGWESVWWRPRSAKIRATASWSCGLIRAVVWGWWATPAVCLPFRQFPSSRSGAVSPGSRCCATPLRGCRQRERCGRRQEWEWTVAWGQDFWDGLGWCPSRAPFGACLLSATSTV